MTADRLAQGGLPVSTVLDMCDRLLAEAGRRRHMFAWLRAPGSAAGEWLPVDAYYPRARVVVMCRPAGDPHEGIYRELIPAHGLGLLRLDPDALGDDEAVVEAALAARIFDLEHVARTASREPARPRRPPAAPAADAPASDRRSAPASDRRSAPVSDRRSAPASDQRSAPESDRKDTMWTPVKVERSAVVPALEQGVGVLVGLGLAGILIIEVYFGVVEVALGAGRVMLGFAIALEACSRALGTVAAARAGERTWAWACAIGGAPFVMWFALGRPSGRAETEPAPLAGLLAAIAVLVGVLGLLLGL